MVLIDWTRAGIIRVTPAFPDHAQLSELRPSPDADASVRRAEDSLQRRLPVLAVPLPHEAAADWHRRRSDVLFLALYTLHPMRQLAD